MGNDAISLSPLLGRQRCDDDGLIHIISKRCQLFCRTPQGFVLWQPISDMYTRDRDFCVNKTPHK
jgi:hypothetical protein